MKIRWFGHSSFLFEDSKGRKLLTDPFDETVGYKVFEGDVDVVTISHNHFDHCYTEKINCKHIINKIGSFNLCDIPIYGIPSYHDKVKGAKRGENVIFIIEMDDYRICHLGDVGYVLSPEEIKSLGFEFTTFLSAVSLPLKSGIKISTVIFLLIFLISSTTLAK